MYKMHGILGLFLLLVIILMLKPRVLFNLYNNILGRVVLIGVVLFFTTCNITLGLLAALCLIIVSNMFFMEGLTNLDGDNNSMIHRASTEGSRASTEGSRASTIGEDNEDGTINTGDKITVETKEQVKANVKAKVSSNDGATISELQEQGVDRASIDESIRPKKPSSIPVDKSVFRSEEVSASDPATTEPFVSSYSIF